LIDPSALANPDAVPLEDLPPLTPELAEAFRSQPRFLVAMSLAEAETLRLILHTNQAALAWAGVALRTVEGALIESSIRFQTTPPYADHEAFMDMCVQCLRFINNEMYFEPREIEVLQAALKDSSVPDRIRFFEDCLRLRRRERHLWGDTPLAQLFTEEGEKHLLRIRAILQQVMRPSRMIGYAQIGLLTEVI